MSTVKRTVIIEVDEGFDLGETMCKAIHEGDTTALQDLMDGVLDMKVAGEGLPDKRPEASRMLIAYINLKSDIEAAIIGVNVGGDTHEQVLRQVVLYLQPFIYELLDDYALAVWEQALRPEVQPCG
jgi:hypothetical protein